MVLLTVCVCIGLAAVMVQPSWAEGRDEELDALFACGVPYEPGQAIVCVRRGHEEDVRHMADSVEELLTVEAGAEGQGPCQLVLAESSSLSTRELVASLLQCEGVVFAEPNYEQPACSTLSEGPLDGTAPADSTQEAPNPTTSLPSPDEQQDDSTPANGAQENKALPKVEAADAQEAAGNPEEDLSSAAEAPQEAQDTETPDLTSRQYAFNGTYGVGVPNWNTYDSANNPTPAHDASGKVVAVVDTGIDYNHEDLRSVMWDEGMNYPDLVALGGGAYGICVCPPHGNGTAYDTTDPMDDWDHGTHVAGIIASAWNGRGVSGAASGARIMAIKVMNDLGTMDVDDALRAYRYVITAMDAGVEVVAINNSWGDEIYSRALDLAVSEAGRKGAVSVFAAGNEATNMGLTSITGNAFANNPYVVMVGNTNKSGQMSERTNFGRSAVDVFAPGEDVYSTIPTGKGPADERAQPLTVGDTTFSCDFESTAVSQDGDAGVFSFKGRDNTGTSLADEGHESSHALCLRPTGEDKFSVMMTSKQLNVGDECRGLCLWVKAPGATHLSGVLSYNTQDGMNGQQVAKLDNPSADWQPMCFSIGSKAVKNALELDLTFSLEGTEEVADVKALVDDIKLVSKTSPYQYMTGTSQAAPAVAGGAAVLSAAFPSDDAALRAARIVGSVLPVQDLADMCVSGGIFRLDKALQQDTAPVLNAASTAGASLTIEGFFFGGSPGTVTVDGQALEISAWSDMSITAKLPSGLEAGVKLVEVTTSEGRSGHQRFRVSTPASLLQRLPLPGRSLSGDPGTYAVTTSAFDESFYSGMPAALVGLDGSLYYLLETPESETAIFRYDIGSQSWEQAYRGGYAAGGGACTWNGKILFVAGDPEQNRTYLATFDPTSNTVGYSLYDSECFERETTLLNTGRFVLLAGGRKFVRGSDRQLSINIVRKLDPATMTLSQVTLPDQLELGESWYASAYDEEGNGYLLREAAAGGLYKFSAQDDNVTCTVMKAGSLFEGLAGNAQDQEGLTAQAEGTMSNEQSLRMAAGPTKTGIIASGPVLTNSAGIVTSDTYTLNWGETAFKTTDRLVSVTKAHNLQGTTYRGSFYVIGASDSEVGGWVFATKAVDTIPQPGDVQQQDAPAEPQPQQAAEHQTAAKGTATATKLPATGDEPMAPTALMAFLGSALIVLARRQARCMDS